MELIRLAGSKATANQWLRIKSVGANGQPAINTPATTPIQALVSKGTHGDQVISVQVGAKVPGTQDSASTEQTLGRVGLVH